MSVWRTLLVLLRDYCVVLGAIYFAKQVGGPLAYLVAIVVIAGRQHSIAFGFHEAAHFNISRNRSINDAIGQLVCAWPLLMDLHDYRHFHLLHHRHLGTEKDPENAIHAGSDWVFPQSRARLALLLVKDCLGLNARDLVAFIRLSVQQGPKHSTADVLLRLAFYAALLVVLALTGNLVTFLVFWIVPIFTVLKAFIRVREIAEHVGVAGTHDLNRTRTTRGNMFDRALIAPLNGNYHLEHHLYPGVPWFNLPALHRQLVARDDYRVHAHVSADFVTAMDECCTGAVWDGANDAVSSGY